MAKVLLQLPTALLMVLLTPSPSMGSLTEVEITLMILPKPLSPLQVDSQQYWGAHYWDLQSCCR